MVRVNIIVEGTTEETFVRDVLGQELAQKGIYLSPRRVETSRRGSRIFRGGMINYAKTKRDINRWLAQDQTAYLTTMFDLYRLPPDFPGFEAAKTSPDPYAKVNQLEDGFASDIAHSRFIPYIQLHEFEGLLFSDIEVIDTLLSIYHRTRLAELQSISSSFATPEEINDGETTAPSKRLQNLFPNYDKVVFGSRIAQRIGLDTLRKKCPHFGEWLSKLEALPE